MQFKERIYVSGKINRPRPGLRVRLWQAVCRAMLLAGFVNPASAALTVTQLANEGVMITDGEFRILIDAMVVEPYSIYGGLPDEAALLFEQVSGPFSEIDMVLVSHRHHDHNQPRYACQYMQESMDTVLIAPSQAIGLMREKCREFITTSPRVLTIDPQYEQAHVIELEKGKITAFPLSHGIGKYARLQNHGHLIELSGMSIVHIGDAAMDSTDFVKAGLDKVKIDVALIPFWYFQPGPGSELVTKFLDAPYKIAVHIPPGEMQEVKEYMAAEYPRVMILSNTLDQATFSAADQPPP